MVFFWMNPRESGGLRLTELGFKCLVEDLELQTYDIKLWNEDTNNPVKINHRFLLDLDRYIECPYYVLKGRWPRILLFDEKVYFWACMHDDFQRFLNGYKV